jgi:uncharacterized membrane protein YdjX (TVP38/TMEM64 family)
MCTVATAKPDLRSRLTGPSGWRPLVPPTPGLGIWQRVLVPLAVGALLVLVATSDTLHGLLLWGVGVAEPVMGARPVLGALVFVALAALSAMLAFFSSAVLVPAALQVWGPPLSALLLWLGWCLGGVFAYTLSRHLGRPVARRLGAADALQRYEGWFTRHAPFGAVLLFQLAVPSEVPGYVLGFVRYRFWKYVLALALAEIPFAIGAAYIGAGLLYRRSDVIVVLVAAGIVLSVGALVLLVRVLRARSQGSPPTNTG